MSSKVLVVCCVVAIVCCSTVSADRHRVGFKKNCKLNRDCKKGLACDVRTEPISNTCLVSFGGMCTRDGDCANNLSCLSGRCACDSSTFYDDDKNDCFKLQIFGEACEEDKQCSGHLICSKLGLKNLCLQDIGESCAQDNDCANNQLCLSGKCGCNLRYQKYNQLTHDCDLQRIDGEGRVCHSNLDCYNPDLSCDLSTYKCKRTIDVFCNTADDCSNGLSCDNDWCSCSSSDRFFNATSKECQQVKQFKESCKENKECAKSLVCDVRVQPTPISSGRDYTCLKDYGAQCSNNSECVNYLPCVNGKCGCRPNYYYRADLNDCFPAQEFGAPCAANKQCNGSLACDLRPSGLVTQTCASQPGAKCSSSFDCVNNAECIWGVCRCKHHSKYDHENQVCKLKSEDDDDEDSREHHGHSHEHHSHEHRGHSHEHYHSREDRARSIGTAPSVTN